MKIYREKNGRYSRIVITGDSDGSGNFSANFAVPADVSQSAKSFDGGAVYLIACTGAAFDGTNTVNFLNEQANGSSGDDIVISLSNVTDGDINTANDFGTAVLWSQFNVSATGLAVSEAVQIIIYVRH